MRFEYTTYDGLSREQTKANSFEGAAIYRAMTSGARTIYVWEHGIKWRVEMELNDEGTPRITNIEREE